MAGWSLGDLLRQAGLLQLPLACGGVEYNRYNMLFSASQGASAATLPDEHAALLEKGTAPVQGPVSCTSTFAWQQKVVSGSPESSFLGSLLPHFKCHSHILLPAGA